MQALFLVFGLAFGLLAFGFLDWAAGVSVFALFVLIGCSWHAQMPPIFPASLAYQWLFASGGYFWRALGGGDSAMLNPQELAPTLMYSLAGLAALVLGFRIVVRLFHRQIFAAAANLPHRYSLTRVFWLTILAFGTSYVFTFIPEQIWFGGAQIIFTLLLLRFVPYFLLIVTVFERGRGYPYLIAGTAWVIAPQFLTGFSTFKEVLLVVAIGALSQWRPWIRTKGQARRNRQVMIYGLAGMLVMAASALVWTGGVKKQWRDQIWAADAAAASPIERMGDFLTTVGQVASNFDMKGATDELMLRLSSSEFYFAYVGQRVPSQMPHEHGALTMMAVMNAVTPRFLVGDKAVLQSDSWLVRKYAGVAVAGDESNTSVGLGYMAEFYIDFGVAGVILLSLAWGGMGGLALAALAKCAPSRELFLALVIGLFVQSFMFFESSFIKMLGGTMMRTIITCAVFLVIGRPFNHWLSERGARTPTPPPPGAMRRLRMGPSR